MWLVTSGGPWLFAAQGQGLGLGGAGDGGPGSGYADGSAGGGLAMTTTRNLVRSAAGAGIDNSPSLSARPPVDQWTMEVRFPMPLRVTVTGYDAVTST